MSILLKSQLGEDIVHYIRTYSRPKNQKDYSHQIYIILPNLDVDLDMILLRETLDKIENRIRIPIFFKNIGLSGYSLLLAKWENNQYLVFHFSQLNSSPQLILVEYTKTPEMIHTFKIIENYSISEKGLAIFNINSVIGDKTSVHLSFIKDMNPQEKLGWNSIVMSITQRFHRFTSKSYLNQIPVPFVRLS